MSNSVARRQAVTLRRSTHQLLPGAGDTPDHVRDDVSGSKGSYHQVVQLDSPTRLPHARNW